MQIVDQEYFHIRSLPEKARTVSSEADNGMVWDPGFRFCWSGEKLNYFNQHWNENDFFAQVYEEEGQVDFVTGLMRFLTEPLEFQGQHWQTMLKQADKIVRSQAMFIRETIFEEVRAKEFPHQPSRLTSLWVSDREGLKPWWNSFKGEKKLIRLRLNGILFRGDNRFLRIGAFSHQTYRENARQYWAGIDDDDLSRCEMYECLFQGDLEVLEITDSM